MKLSSGEVYLSLIFLSGRACHGFGPTSLIRDAQCVSNSSEVLNRISWILAVCDKLFSSELFYKSRGSYPNSLSFTCLLDL